MHKAIAVVLLAACAAKPEVGSQEWRINNEVRACFQDCMRSSEWTCTTRGAGHNCTVGLGDEQAQQHLVCVSRAYWYRQLRAKNASVSGACGTF